ncbi:hypothetical protein [Oleiagrimonas sp. MCCC 1A03011]|uniref:hypothetical protein n=1 Tax=Oleiagrimonas sp. MCCC 1A03011 TaxID=1926883 RepID=UPI000DC3B876|nr:hypothetical protein [Oleiagrimonas sp. MCCC 1A03011]RAP58516.1 hypothetical protein BTJ49_06190 [Oleiagrimonas sp. MCCC 1A03011]
MNEMTFRRMILPLRTVGVPCLRVSVRPLPAANTALGEPVSGEDEKRADPAGVQAKNHAGKGGANGPGDAG